METPSVSSLRSRKILGVPVLYLAGAGVAVLAVYAWRLKPAANTPADTASEPTDGPAPAGEYLYPAMPSGTVVVAPSDAPLSGNASVGTNEEWLRAGVAYLIADGMGGGQAQEILQAYLEGAQLSYTQGQVRDKVIAELGLPPFPPYTGGTAPAAKTSLGFFRFDDNDGWAIYELYSDRTKRWVSSQEWAGRSGVTTQPIDSATLEQYR